MSNKLFVGGLAWTTNEAGLRAAFSKYGDVVESKIVTDRDSGRSRGFGFVTFTNADSASKARELNGTELDGRQLRVDIASDKPKRDRY